MISKTPPGLLREQTGKTESFPCEGEAAQIAHVTKYKITSRWLVQMRKMTERKRLCKWLSCPVYGRCDLLGWGGEDPERESTGDMLIAMMPDFTEGRGPFSDKEHHFLMDLLERFEGDDKYIPTKRQTNWLSSLYDRWVEVKR